MVHKVVAVTGASRGLGFEFIRQFALTQKPPHQLLQNATSYTIIALVRDVNVAQKSPQFVSLHKDLDALNETNKNDNNYISRQLILLPFEVTNIEHINSVKKYIEDNLDGRLDILINNAGIVEPQGFDIRYITSFNDERYQNVLNVNTIAPVIISNIFAPLLTKAANNQPENIKQVEEEHQHEGTKEQEKKTLQNVQVVFISSLMGSIEICPQLCDTPVGSTYKTSKAALNMYGKELAHAYKNINFLTISPGWCQTDMGNYGATEDAKPTTLPKESISGMLNEANKYLYREASAQKLHSFDGATFPW